MLKTKAALYAGILTDDEVETLHIAIDVAMAEAAEREMVVDVVRHYRADL
jgi:hypothetical protein